MKCTSSTKKHLIATVVAAASGGTVSAYECVTTASLSATTADTNCLKMYKTSGSDVYACYIADDNDCVTGSKKAKKFTDTTTGVFGAGETAMCAPSADVTALGCNLIEYNSVATTPEKRC